MSGTQPKQSPTSYELAPVHNVDTESAEPIFVQRPPEIKAKPHPKTLSPQRWGFEILSVFTSLILFVGMVVIFVIMQGKPVTRWPFAISINAAIAVLSTACTAAMMHNVSAFIGQLKWLYLKGRPRQLDTIQTFDEASRGPYGSIVFLFKLSWNMATLGAIITILRLGFSPMVQQVIDLELRPVPVPNDNTTFGFAHAYNKNLPSGQRDERPPDLQMQSAMIKGLYDIKTDPAYNCTSRCSWDERWVSLGFKSVCENVTVPAISTRSCKDNSTGKILSNKEYEKVFEGGPFECNFTTPGGVLLETHSNPLTWSTIFGSRATAVTDYRRTSPNLFKVAIFRSGLDMSYKETWTDVMECNISYVAYEYTNATVSGNSFSFGKTRMIDLKWDVDYDKDHPLDLRPLISTSTKDDIPTLYSNPMDEAALADFIGSETFRLEYIKGDRGYVPHGLSAMLGGEVNISQRFDNMASSMTEYLRSGPNTQLAKGNQIESQNYVIVNWYWLTGPAILELAALIFAICTIVSNARKHKVPLWKSSALVLLACQHDEDEGLIRGTTETVAELEKRAKSSRAKLE